VLSIYIYDHALQEGGGSNNDEDAKAAAEKNPKNIPSETSPAQDTEPAKPPSSFRYADTKGKGKKGPLVVHVEDLNSTAKVQPGQAEEEVAGAEWSVHTKKGKRK
jgi:hypothetical protein